MGDAAAALEQCLAMGFDPERSKRAIELKGTDMDQIMEWMFDTAEQDADSGPSPLVTIDEADQAQAHQPPYGSGTGDFGPEWVNHNFSNNQIIRSRTPDNHASGGNPFALPPVAGSGVNPPPLRQRHNSPVDTAPVDLSSPGASTAVAGGGEGPNKEHSEFIGKVMDISGPSTPPAYGPHKKDEDDDMSRAIQASLGQNLPGLSKEDEEMNKAMAMSMASLDDVDMSGETGAGNGMSRAERDARQLAQSIAPEHRIRHDFDPVALRSPSPHLSGFSAFLQCLYHVPAWRAAVLTFYPGEHDLYPDSARTYKDFWLGLGDFHPPDFPDPLDRSNPDHYQRLAYARLHSLQRLFSLMVDTKRSWLSTADAEFNWHIAEFDFKFGSMNGGDWVKTLALVYENMVLTLREEEYKRIANLEDMGDIDAEAGLKARRSSLSRFTTIGREIENNKFIDTPLPAMPDEDLKDVAVLRIIADTSGPTPDHLFAALDRALVTRDPADPTNIISFSLLSVLPQCITIHIDRNRAIDFGKTKKVFRLEERIFIDRYTVKKRKLIGQAREKLRVLELEKKEIEELKNKLAVTKDGKDAILLLKTTLSYLESATSDVPERTERQKTLAAQYQLILTRMEEKIAEYDAKLFDLEAASRSVWEADELKTEGPYDLCAILMRSGLNGRGSAWAVVKDDGGKWWKMGDMTAEEITLEEALQDPTGLMMDAGASLAFYQYSKDKIEVPPLPYFLENEIIRDNWELAAQVPLEIAHSWQLPQPSPPTGSPLFDPRDLPSLPSTTDTDANDPDIPVDILVAPSPPTAMRVDEEPVIIEHLDLTEEQDGENEAETSAPIVADKKVEKPETDEVDGEDMAIDVDELETIPSDSEDVLRLRGGAGDVEMDGGNEEEEDDDDEIDEDEVELGCLKAMPDEWDVDVAVGKVGGLPVWLDPTSPLAHEDVKCAACGCLMPLLIQLNSPDDTRPHAAARALYVFACTTKDCIAKSSERAIKILRIQTPSPNAFYPHTAESLAKRKELEAALDGASHLAGPSLAGMTHAKPLKEWDVECESEPYEESFLAGAKVDNVGGEEEGTEDAAEPDTKVGVDRAFLIFQERVERMPEQVLRFYRLPGVEEPEPLWISTVKIPPEEVPSCPLCHGRRQVEFQLLSTLLNYIQSDDLQFDSLLFYTCQENCAIPPKPSSGEGTLRSGWAEEVVRVLEFGKEGVQLPKENDIDQAMKLEVEEEK